MSDTKRLLTPEQVATRLSVSRSWVYGHADWLRVVRIRRTLRFHEHIIEKVATDGKPDDYAAL